MGEFFTIPPEVVLEEADGTKHTRADGNGPVTRSWNFPVTVYKQFSGYKRGTRCTTYEELLRVCWH